MLEILSIGYFVGIGFAVFGGIIFAQWPRPSLVRTVRITGMAFGAVSLLFTCPFAVLVHLQSPQLPTWLLLGVAFVLPVGLWFILAWITDLLTGCHVFGQEDTVFIIEEDEPRHTKGRHLNILV